MKYYKLLFPLSIFLFHFLSCSDSTDSSTNNSSKQKFLFEVDYVNFAWGFTYHGTYIDELGYVYKNDLKDTKDTFLIESDYFTSEYLERKYRHNKQFIKKILLSELNEKAKLIEKASKGNYSDTVSKGEDMGSIEYKGYLYDTHNKKYRPVVLRVEGDYYYENLSIEAKILADWLESVLKR